MTTKPKTSEQTTDTTPPDSKAVATAAATPQPTAAADTAPEGAAADNLLRPRRQKETPIVVACPMSEEQAALQQDLAARSERLRSHKIDPCVDNDLAITADARKLALDARMLSPQAQDHPNSKINTLVDNVYAIWQRTEPVRGAQVIFADLGVKPTPWGFSAYNEIMDKLAARGIPRQQIAAIGDADSQARKRDLLDRVRSGQVRVLLGSTHKMGATINVAKYLAALHHLDCPWMPPDIEQREGYSLRQGHENEDVAIYRYATEKSLDTFLWRALETRAKFMSQVMDRLSGGAATSVIFDGQEISAAEGQRRDASEEPVATRTRRRSEERASADGQDGQTAQSSGKWQQKLAEEARADAERLPEPG